jgi:hypothetical protein
MGDRGGERLMSDEDDTMQARAKREANIWTLVFIALIGFSFALDAFPATHIVGWIIAGGVVAWVLWLLVIRDLILDWQIDREINRPLSPEAAKRMKAAIALTQRPGHRRQAGSAPPHEIEQPPKH